MLRRCARVLKLWPNSLLQLNKQPQPLLIERIDALKQLCQRLIPLPGIRVHFFRLHRLLLLLLDAHVEVHQDANDWREELLQGGGVRVHLFGEEDYVLVDFADEDGVHHKHNEVH